MKRKVKVLKPCLECGGQHKRQDGGDSSVKKGACAGTGFGGSDCPPGSPQYNLAKTFRKTNKTIKTTDSAPQNQNIDEVTQKRLGLFKNFIAGRTTMSSIEETLVDEGIKFIEGGPSNSAFGYNPNSEKLDTFNQRAQELNDLNLGSMKGFGKALLTPTERKWSFENQMNPNASQDNPNNPIDPVNANPEGTEIDLSTAPNPYSMDGLFSQPSEADLIQAQEGLEIQDPPDGDKPGPFVNNIPNVIADTKAKLYTGKKYDPSVVNAAVNPALEKAKTYVKPAGPAAYNTAPVTSDSESFEERMARMKQTELDKLTQVPDANYVAAQPTSGGTGTKKPSYEEIKNATSLEAKKVAAEKEKVAEIETRIEAEKANKGSGAAGTAAVGTKAEQEADKETAKRRGNVFDDEDPVTTPTTVDGVKDPNWVPTELDIRTRRAILPGNRIKGFTLKYGDPNAQPITAPVVTPDEVPATFKKPVVKTDPVKESGFQERNPIPRYAPTGQRIYAAGDEVKNDPTNGFMDMFKKNDPSEEAWGDEAGRIIGTSQRDVKGIAKKFAAPTMDLLAAIGRGQTEPDFAQQAENLTSADNVFTPNQGGDRGFNMFNPTGFDPGINQTPVQFRGSAYKQGGEYELSEEEIQQFLEAGGQVEYI